MRGRSICQRPHFVEEKARQTRNDQVGNHLIKPARDAKQVRIFGVHKPVANLVLLTVPASAIGSSLGRWRQGAPRSIGGQFQRAQFLKLRHKAQRVAATYTLDVFKENQAATMLAMKCLQALSLPQALTCLGR